MASHQLLGQGASQHSTQIAKQVQSQGVRVGRPHERQVRVGDNKVFG